MDGPEKLDEPPCQECSCRAAGSDVWRMEARGRLACPPSLTPRRRPQGLMGNQWGQSRWSDSDFVEQTVTNLRELLWRPDSVMVTLLLSPSLIWI